MSPESPLTLEGLADILWRSAEATDRRFQAVEGQVQALTNRVDSLTGQVEALVALMREQGLRMTLLADQHAQHDQQVRQILHRLEQEEARLADQNDKFLQILHRLEQNDARLAEQQAEIRRILDLLERRGGDGGPPSG